VKSHFAYSAETLGTKIIMK